MLSSIIIKSNDDCPRRCCCSVCFTSFIASSAKRGWVKRGGLERELESGLYDWVKRVG